MVKRDWLNDFLSLYFSGNSESVKEAILLKNNFIPCKLFKYKSLDLFTLDSIINETVYMSDPINFNDPFDSVASYEIDRQLSKLILSHEGVNSILDENKKTNSLPEDKLKMALETPNPLVNLKKLVAEFYPEVTSTTQSIFSIFYDNTTKYVKYLSRKMVKISCFTEADNDTPNNMPLWYHYADKYQGISIEYDMNIFNNADVQRVRMYPVEYEDQMFDITDIFLLNNFGQKAGFDTRVAMRKHSNWSYEKEWRYIIGNDIIEKAGSYPFHAVSSIYMGYRINESHEKILRSIAQYKNIRLFKMKLGNKGIEFE